MRASERQAILADGEGAGVFSPSTRSKSASFVEVAKRGKGTGERRRKKKEKKERRRGRRGEEVGEEKR